MKIGAVFPRPGSIAELPTVELTALDKNGQRLPAEQNSKSTETAVSGFIEFEILPEEGFDLEIALKLGSGEVISSLKLANLNPESQSLVVDLTLNTGEVLRGAISVNPKEPGPELPVPAPTPSPDPQPVDINAGIQHCTGACEAFVASGVCDAFPGKYQFCLPENRQLTCEARYNDNPGCVAEFFALDACFESGTFDCFAGSPVTQNIPFAASDSCVIEVNALNACLGQGA